jgi:S1-C subfamily serine protease
MRRYVRSALGVQVVALKKALETLYSPIDRGFLVVDMVSSSPAEEVGLAGGDVVTKVNDIFELGSSWESL